MEELLSWIYTLRGGGKNTKTQWKIPVPVKTTKTTEATGVLS
jgi:hypothetical protein